MRRQFYEGANYEHKSWKDVYLHVKKSERKNHEKTLLNVSLISKKDKRVVIQDHWVEIDDRIANDWTLYGES